MDACRKALLNLDHAYDVTLGDKTYHLPATPLASLGDPTFLAAHHVRFPYMAGAMATGIASVELVASLANHGFLAAYGAAGQSLPTVAAAITALRLKAPGQTFGVNLIHSPQQPQLEAALADLLVEEEVPLVEASAFMAMTLPVVRYRLAGIHEDRDGHIVTPNRVIAKVSRLEVATPFLSPSPPALVAQLVAKGLLTPAQAQLASRVPVAEDVTVEADSGGHTDNRPLVALLPSILALRDRLMAQYQYRQRPRIGAAGGLSTPASACAAFAMGAAYIVTGSVNQACVESGTSDVVRQALATAGPADVAMAPAADMFEMGVKVQVLKHGTMFPMRAQKLYDYYLRFGSLEALPAKEREQLEEQVFKGKLDDVWLATKTYFQERDRRQCERAERDPKHKMALVFRAYLGQASGWAKAGLSERRFDFQVWCGPAMGAFNEWAKGSVLEQPKERFAVTVALNLLFGAAVMMRGQILRAQGAPAELVPSGWQPHAEAEIRAYLEGKDA